LSAKEERGSYDLRKSNIIPFQLLKSLEHWIRMKLTTDAVIRITEGKGVIRLDRSDVETSLFVPLPQHDSEKNTKDSFKVAPTKEYVQLVNALRGRATKFPRDLWREKNKYLSGCTTVVEKESSDTKAKRQDFVFLYDCNPIDSKELLQFDCVECNLVTLKHPQSELVLSDHLGLEASVSFRGGKAFP